MNQSYLQVATMNYKRGEPTPEYLRALSDFITKSWRKLPSIGKHYHDFKYINDFSKQEYSKEPKGGDRNQYSKYVNSSGRFKQAIVNEIFERLEFIVFDKFENKLGLNAFDDWVKAKKQTNENSFENQDLIPFNDEKGLLIKCGYLYFLSEIGFALTSFFKFNPEQEYQKVKAERIQNGKLFDKFKSDYDTNDTKFALNFWEFTLSLNIEGDCISWFPPLFDKVLEYADFMQKKIENLSTPREKKIAGVFLIGYFIGSVYFRKKLGILTNKEYIEKFCTEVLPNGTVIIGRRIVPINNGDQIDLCSYEIDQILAYSPAWLERFDELISKSELERLEINLKSMALNKDNDSLQFLKDVFKNNYLPMI